MTNHDLANQLLEPREAPSAAESARIAPGLARQVSESTDTERCVWMQQLAEADRSRLRDADTRLQEVLRLCSRQILAQRLEESPARWAQAVATLYRALPASSLSRYWLLLLLNRSSSVDELAGLADLLAEDPPQDANAPAAVVAKLLQNPPDDLSPLFPRLLDGLKHPNVAAPILDLANYLHRNGVLTEHPCASRHKELAELLGQLVHQMQTLETQRSETPRQDTAQQIDASVALAVGLCDALGRIGRTEHVGKLVQAMDLRHRRIRLVAAASLAALGEDCGRDVVVELAAEPVVRLYALEAADAYGFGDKIDAAHRTPYARAEAQLALWLAQPSQFGIPPTALEALEERTTAWPGCDDPQTVFLIRFEYQLGDKSYTNIGIAGPAPNTCAADLLEMNSDDLFALFAGAEIDHEEVYEVAMEHLDAGQAAEAARLQVLLRAAGYEDIATAYLCYFLGDVSLAAMAQKDGRAAVVVADGSEIVSRPVNNPQRPLTPTEAIALYRGRKFLQTFAPAE